MRSFVTCTVLASVASLAAAGLPSSWEYPEGVPVVEKRQDPGTPRYACHENCGTLITLGRTEGYCDTSEWSTRYAACMACANEFGIWIYYRNGVTNAAEECGLSPTPSPSGAAPETTATAASTTTTTTTAAATTPAPTESAAEPVTTSTSAAAPPPASQEQSSAATTAAGVPTTLTTATTATTAAAASSAASGSATPSGTAASGTSAAHPTRVTSIGTSVVIPSGSPTPSAVFAGASKNSGVLGAVGVVGLVLAAL